MNNILSPLDQFEVRSLLSINLPNIGLYLIIAGYIVFFVSLLSSNNNKIVPNAWSVSHKSFCTVLHSTIGQINVILSNFKHCLKIIYIDFMTIITTVPPAPLANGFCLVASCPHVAIGMAACAACIASGAYYTPIRNCIHPSWFSMKSDSGMVGATCDFAGTGSAHTFHSVSTTVGQTVWSCAKCHAMSCSDCYTG